MMNVLGLIRFTVNYTIMYPDILSQLYNHVLSCTIMYSVVQSCTQLYNHDIVLSCTIMYSVVAPRLKSWNLRSGISSPKPTGRTRSTSENRIALANRTIEGDLLMVRWYYSRGLGK